MKKIMSRILIILLITILVFEFSCSNISFAASSIDAETINLISNLIGGIVSIVMWLPKLLSTVEVWLFSLIITDNIASADGKVDGTSTLITPYDIFFNHYNILDINVFAQKDEGTIGGAIRVSVAHPSSFHCIHFVQSRCSDQKHLKCSVCIEHGQKHIGIKVFGIRLFYCMDQSVRDLFISSTLQKYTYAQILDHINQIYAPGYAQQRKVIFFTI